MYNNGQIFLKSKGKVSISNNKPVLLKDLAEISADKEIKNHLESLNYPINTKEQINVLISVLSLVTFIRQNVPDIDLVVIGQTDVLVHFYDEKIKENMDKFKVLRVILVCFLLFVGAITAIINFHADVDMKQAHSTIYKIITGEESNRPLLIQIPYSLGLGAGMAIFFNHVFKKKINNEPTPLEMKMYSYQQSVDEYVKNQNHGQQ